MESMRNKNRVKDIGGYGMIGDDDIKLGLLRFLIFIKVGDFSSNKENFGVRIFKNVVIIY